VAKVGEAASVRVVSEASAPAAAPASAAPKRSGAPARAGGKGAAAGPKAATTRTSGPEREGPLGARHPGSRSRFAEGEGAVEALRSSNRGASLEERALASGGVRHDETPGRTPGRRASPAGTSAKKATTTAKAPAKAKAPSKAPAKAPAKAKAAATKSGVPPASERVLVGDLENGLPTGVTGELVPEDLHTGSPSSSDVNPVGLRTGELDPLGARRGHLLGNLFGGSGRDRGNLAWMHKRINNSDFKVQFENPLRRALESGETVLFGVRPKYRGDEVAPYAVEVWATTTSGKVIVPVRDIASPGLSDVTR
jgi:hypothetical protein